MKLQKLLDEKKYLIMGILNFTPDSFSDGGNYFTIEKAIEQVKEMINYGTDIIDIGAESTRPGAVAVSAEEEKRRLSLIIPELIKRFPNICFSIDTYKAEVAEYALELGVDIINDVLGAKDNGMAKVSKKYAAPIIVMHNGGVSEGSEIDDVVSGLKESVELCLAEGVPLENIIVDPGMGFGKQAEHNIKITNNLEKLLDLNCDVLYAVSRKRTTDFILGGETNPKDRDVVSGVLSLTALQKGARIIRMHNVKVMKEIIDTQIALEKFK